MFLLTFFKKYKLVLLISLLLFSAPFFWLKPGEVDLGGDSNRLYFYDPISFIKYTSIYNVFAIGRGSVEQNYYYLPFVALLAFLKSITLSPTSIISLFNGIKLAGGFVAIYLIVRELLLQENEANNRKNVYIAAILAGLFYVVSFGSFNMAIFWGTALTSHNQIFLNPVIFYLLLKFFLTHTYKYLWIALLVSFVFSPNFGMTSAPPFFAFYPLASLFLFSYTIIFGKKSIPWKGVCIGFILFLGIHAFHLLGQVISLFESGSDTNRVVFNKEYIKAGGVNYFSAVSGFGKASLNLLLPSKNEFLKWLSLLAPSIVIIGFLLNRRKKEFLIISLFFIITLFLTTANITNIGFELYRRLFYIPGFSMFRNFYTQWLFIFVFFYSLLFGFATYSILEKLKPYYTKVFFFFVFVVLIITSISLISGELISKNIWGSNNVKTLFIMDPNYEETLQFVRTLPDDGKILVLPLTDFNYQVIYGKNGGAYMGPSILTHLAGKYSFVGYQNFGYQGNTPYAEDIMKYSREKNYKRLLSIFTTLNIRYILHNSDPMVYEKDFSPGPYGYMQTSMPKTQKGYVDFIKHFPFKQIYKNGQYVLYEIDKSLYNPTIFIPNGVYQSNKLSFDQDKTHAVFIDESTCSREEFKKLCRGGYKASDADVSFKMINLALYEVTIRQEKPQDSMLLVMQHTFHKGWKLVIDGKEISENKHITVNGYVNGWFLIKKDLSDKESYTLFIKLDPQKYFWYGLSISAISLFIILVLIMPSFIKRVLSVLSKSIR